MKVKQLLLDNELTRPALRTNVGSRYFISKPEAIVIHWTGNTDKGANAIANRNYFNKIKNRKQAASAHYIVDQNGVVQCIPDNEVAFHVGDTPRKYYNKDIRFLLLEGKKYQNPNYYTLGIEMCVNRGNNWVATYEHTIELVKSLMEKYNIPQHMVMRHYDLTGKDCPNMFLPHDMSKPDSMNWNWLIFHRDISSKPKVIEKIKEVVKEVPEQLTALQHLSMFFKKIFK